MLKKMALNIGSVSFVLAAVMVLASLSSILLGRVLTRAQFGEFALVRTLILLIAPLAIWGQDVATARFFSQQPPAHFKWDVAFRNIMIVAFVLVVIGVAIADSVYRFDFFKIMGVAMAALFYASSLFFSNLVRSQQRYTRAILMISGFRGLFFFFLITAFFANHITKSFAIGSYISVIILVGLFNVWYAFRTVPRGSEPVPVEMHRTGLILMGIQGSIAIISYLDGLFIPKVLGYETMGLYAATVVPVQAFAILARAAKYVWVPEFGRSKQVRFKFLTAVVAAIALALLLIMVVGAEPILHILYRGKYDEGASLLRILAMVGVFRLFYGLSSSLIVGRLSNTALKYHLGVTIASMLIYAFALLTMLRVYGIMGAGYALLVLTFVRMMGSYWIVYRFRHATA